MEIKSFIQGFDGKVKELIIDNGDGTTTKFVPEERKEEVTVTVTETKTSKKSKK